MKKVILAVLAASVAAAPAAAAPFHGYGHGPAVKQVQTVKHKRNGEMVVKSRQVIQPAWKQGQTRRWAKGQRFDSRYARNYRVISNPRAYRLHDAPYGYRYVQSGSDAVLVSVATGLIAAVLAGALS